MDSCRPVARVAHGPDNRPTFLSGKCLPPRKNEEEFQRYFVRTSASSAVAPERRKVARRRQDAALCVHHEAGQTGNIGHDSALFTHAGSAESGQWGIQVNVFVRRDMPHPAARMTVSSDSLDPIESWNFYEPLANNNSTAVLRLVQFATVQIENLLTT